MPSTITRNMAHTLVGVLLLALALCAQGARMYTEPAKIERVGEWVKPWFCHDLDCPEFTSKKNLSLSDGTVSIELRTYPAAKWVSTVIEDVRYDKAVAQGFFRLFKYISGENTAETKITMTAPVLVRVVPGQGPACNDNFTISFYIPYEFQDAPPEPTSEYVHLTDLPELSVYVYGFGGFATGAKWVANGEAVTQALQDAGYPVDTDHYYAAAYDSPFRLLNRHNEVWIPKGAAPPTPEPEPEP